MPSFDEPPSRTRVLSLQTTLLGNKTYGELLRRAFEHSKTIDFDAHWTTEQFDLHKNGRLERQLERVFLKMVQRRWIRRRNLDFFPLRFELGTSYWGRRTLQNLMRSRHPDVLHVHTQANALLSADVMLRVPTVISADGTSYQMAAQQLESRWRWTFGPQHVLERLVFSSAAAVVVFSEWAAKSVILDHGIAPQKVHIIPPGVDVARLGVRRTRDQRADGIKRILFVGSEFERKGGPLLVQTFLRRFGSDPAVELHIVTPEADVPVHPRIIVHRNVAPLSAQWLSIYGLGDVFAMPTTRDHSPLVYLEAMAAGLPVVTTPVGAASEIVLNGKTGLIVPVADGRALGDALERLLSDDALLLQYAEAGRRRVEDCYEAGKNARRLEALFVATAGAYAGQGRTSPRASAFRYTKHPSGPGIDSAGGNHVR